MQRSFARVAVVQLAYYPAILVDMRSPLEDPSGIDAVLPASTDVSEGLRTKLEELRQRTRSAYCAQIRARVQAVLEACLGWGVRVVVFPEYSIPWDVLEEVARTAGDMVVVAGTHMVDSTSRQSRIYERLGWDKARLPGRGQAVAPVIHRGKLLALSTKLNQATAVGERIVAGNTWELVDMPDGIVGPMAVMVCLDFVYRESSQHRNLVAERLGQSRFLAVPSLTGRHTVPDFAQRAWEEAKRYGRPVLYTNDAQSGGTSVFVDEEKHSSLRPFPQHVGALDTGEEGVIVADVDLGFVQPGGSKPYDYVRPVEPFAAASFVYRALPHDDAYAGWLKEIAPIIARDGDESLDELAERVVAAGKLLRAGAKAGARARKERLDRLLSDVGKATRVEEIRQLTREVVMPAGLLPFDRLRAALAKGAAEAVHQWTGEHPELGGTVKRLRDAGGAIAGADWTEGGKAAANAVADAVRGTVEVTPRVVLSPDADPASLGARSHGGPPLSSQSRPEGFSAKLHSHDLLHLPLGEAHLEVLLLVLDHIQKQHELPTETQLCRGLPLSAGIARLELLKELRSAFLVPMYQGNRYRLSPAGLLACDTGESRELLERCEAILGALKKILYMDLTRPRWSVTDLAAVVRRPKPEVSMALAILDGGTEGLHIDTWDPATWRPTQGWSGREIFSARSVRDQARGMAPTILNPLPAPAEPTTTSQAPALERAGGTRSTPSSMPATAVFVSIVGLTSMNGPEPYAAMSALHRVLRETLLVPPRPSGIRVLSCLTGAILLVPDDANVEVLDLFAASARKIADAGTAVHAGVAHGHVEILVDADGTRNAVGVCLNVAARLAYAEANAGVLVHDSYADHMAGVLPAAHWLHPGKRIPVTIPGKRQEIFQCFAAPPGTIEIRTESSIPSADNPSPTFVNAVLLAYDLPRFSEGDASQLASRFRSVVQEVRRLRDIGAIPSDAHFSFSPGGDGAILALTNVHPGLAHDMAERLERLLEVETSLKIEAAAVEARISVHYGPVFLYESAERASRPTGTTLFDADALASDDEAKKHKAVIVSGALIDIAAHGSRTYQREHFEEIAALQRSHGREIRRFVRRAHGHSPTSPNSPGPSASAVGGSQTVHNYAPIGQQINNQGPIVLTVGTAPRPPNSDSDG